MDTKLSIDSLRAALKKTDESGPDSEEARFEAMARRYEQAVQKLVSDTHNLVKQIPELTCTLEDEVETFTSPAFPGRSREIHDQRVRITRGEDMLLFDPTATALLSALGQIEIQATRPLPFLIEKVLYLIPTRSEGKARWGYRSVANLDGPVSPFDQDTLLRLLHCVFAAE